MVMMRECDASGESTELFDANFIPTVDDIFDIGSAARRVHDLFLGGSIFMDGAAGEGILIGATSLNADAGALFRVNIVGVGSGTDGSRVISTGANTGALGFYGYKTRSTGTDANTIVASGDTLLKITAYGADGADYQTAAQIGFLVDATPGAGDMPGAIAFSTAADGAAALLERWRVNSSGDLAGNTTNGGNILFQKALTGVADNIATLAAAGSSITDAAQIVTTSVRVTGANGTVGVKLPALASVPVGFKMRVINSNTSSALLLYSAAAGELISGQAGNTAISIAAKLTVFIEKYDATNWYLAKGVLPY